MFDHKTYVPILKWRRGEYMALSDLPPEAKKKLFPLVEIPPIEWDFEEQKAKRSMDDHLSPFAKRLKQRWGTTPIFLDCQLLQEPRVVMGGLHALQYLFTNMEKLKLRGIPVTSLDRDSSYQSAVKAINLRWGTGVCVRLSLDDLANSPSDSLVSLMTWMEAAINQTDIVIDLTDANFEPLEDLVGLIWGLLEDFPEASECRTLTIAATAFPKSMSDYAMGWHKIARKEWMLYKALLMAAPENVRKPSFGDYAIAHPSLPKGDMRLLKPSATIRYAAGDSWILAKGQNVRDYKFGQYKGFCQTLKLRTEFLGSGFSFGSDYIDKCASGKVSTGNLTTWRRVGTNHHIAKVLHDLAIYHGP